MSTDWDKGQLADVAAMLARDEPALKTSQDFGPYVHQGAGHGPSVLIGDQSVIELYSGARSSMLDYRMALLAQKGDIAIVQQRSLAFETYLAEYLAARAPTFLEAPADGISPIAKRCRTLAHMRNVLGQRLDEAGTLTIRSYLTTGHDWRLAQSLGESIGNPVHVYGAAPRVARRANDKLWFWRLVRKVVGVQGVAPTFHAFGPAAAAAQVARIHASDREVIVKVPSSAGGSGNLRLTRSTIEGLGLGQIRAMIVRRLRAAGWAGVYPILVGVWESGVVRSPSAQVFVPLKDDGDPSVKGLFEQRVTGAEGQFTGAVPAKLAPSLHDKMCSEAKALATVLQALGYFGWCSFDAIVREDGMLHWIECNGRWSGVSIPLTAATMLIGTTPGGIAIAQDHLARPVLPFDAVVNRLEDLLVRADAPDEGLILTSPQNPQDPALSFNAVAFASDQATAEVLLEQARNRLR